MPKVKSSEIVFNTLYQSPLLNVSDYVCQPRKRGMSDEEEAEKNGIVLLRHGSFTRHFGKRRVTADVNQAVFFSQESVYRVSHPSHCGDRGTLFILAAPILNEIVREFDPSVEENPNRPFRFVTGPCELSIFRRHRDFVMKLESAEASPLEQLWADETAIQLVADVLKSAFDHHLAPRETRRDSTDQDHVELTEAAKMYLAEHIGEVITLNEVARAVHASPYSFARIFRRQTGLPLHRYLTQLRLRASLERLTEDKSVDLTSVALDLGFSSHSHFTEVFRREWGITPSEIRKNPREEISKNLIAG